MKIKKLFMIFSLAVSFSIGVFVYGENTFTPQGQKWEPAPSGHEAGRDNGVVSGDSGENGLHFQGEDCGICHSPGKKAGKYVFTVSGTIYRDKVGREPLAGAEVILRDVQNNIISMTTNNVGNFFTYTPVAWDPAAGDDPETPRNWRYKSWVKYGDQVRPMVTLAYVGAYAHYLPRMSCNMHHGLNGTRGTVSSGNFDTLPAFPESGLGFSEHVMPILKNRCKACHMPQSTNPVTRYGQESFDYSGGLDLSGYNGETDSEKGIIDVVDTTVPAHSALLTKTQSGSMHSGGVFWESGDSEYAAIYRWVEEGAQNN